MTEGPARGAFGVVALILTAQTLANIGPLGIPAVATLIRDDLDLTLTQAGSFLSAYYVGPSLLSLPAGTLADTWGIKRTLVIGQLIIGLGLVAVSASTSYAMLVVLMAVAGCGYGFLNPTSTKAVMVWSPAAHRATLVGLKQVGLPLGGAIGAALLPVLGLAFGWRLAVVVSGLVMGVTALATLVVYRDPPAARVPVARVAPHAAIREVLTTRDLWLVAVATGGFAAMQTVWMAFLVLYLHERVGVSLLAAARYLALAQVAGMVGRVVFGLLSDRLFGGRRVAPLVIAGSGSAACSIAIAFAAPGISPLVLVPLTTILGFAGIGWNGVQHTLMAELAGPRAAGTALGLGLAVSSVGVTVGPPVFGLLVTWSGGFELPWIALAVMIAGALALLALVRERRGVLA